MNIKKKIEHWCSRDILSQSVPYFGLFLTEKDFKKALKKLKVPKDSYPKFLPSTADAATHTLESDGKICCLVTIVPQKDTEKNQVASLLCHEAVHIWQVFRDHIGERSPSHEFEAYSIQYLTQELLYKYDELTK